MSFRRSLPFLILLAFAACAPSMRMPAPEQPPNIVLIYADDLGYGDVSANGATRISTPNIDRIAREGLRFTHAHSAAATCTPSRFAMLTGQYAFRQAGTNVLPGDAAAIIPPGRVTLASILKEAGYTTGVVGKWHLGLGPDGGPDWNGEIRPGPLEIGFDYAFLMPATGDRVPTVYVENHRVVGLDPSDPIQVSFKEKVGSEPTGRENPELLTLHPSHGHDFTIVNGISRIGYMSGGKSARWQDTTMARVFASKAVEFIEQHRDERFFLFFSTHDIHVPRVPHRDFAGRSGMGPRGDAILQLDWQVGQVLDALDRLGLRENTLVIFSSDNGPVVDDGYQDQAVELLGDHRPAGPFRGGKYSAFEGGTRVATLVRWPGVVPAGRTSNALISQVDFPATMAALAGVKLPSDAAPDSEDQLAALLGRSDQGREYLIEQATARHLAIVRGRWKYIPPNQGPRVSANTNTELGNDPEPQLYDLEADPGETRNVAAEHPDIVQELSTLLGQVVGEFPPPRASAE
ncbi:MAG TPA: arylsulfatase [Longimicrobiaceae bacterium]